MTKEKIYELLEIENGSEITYFEDFAAIVENGAIDPEALHGVLAEADMKTMSELIESYFYDVMESMPDDVDLYTLFEAIRRNLVVLAEAAGREEEGALRKLSDELSRFAEYYSQDITASCTEGASRNTRRMTLMEAIIENRLARMDNKELSFDMADALNYPMDEYVVSISDLAEREDEE